MNLVIVPVSETDKNSVSTFEKYESLSDSSFTHIAISTKMNLGDAVWLDTVSDDEYNSYIKQ